jgi:hypothetical protein
MPVVAVAVAVADAVVAAVVDDDRRGSCLQKRSIEAFVCSREEH